MKQKKNTNYISFLFLVYGFNNANVVDEDDFKLKRLERHELKNTTDRFCFVEERASSEY